MDGSMVIFTHHVFHGKDLEAPNWNNQEKNPLFQVVGMMYLVIS